MECFLSCLWDGRNALPCGTQGLHKKPSIARHIFEPVCLGDKPRLPCCGATLQLPLLRDRWKRGVRAFPVQGKIGVSEPRGVMLLGNVGSSPTEEHFSLGRDTSTSAPTAQLPPQHLHSSQMGNLGDSPCSDIPALWSHGGMKGFADQAINPGTWGCSCC